MGMRNKYSVFGDVTVIYLEAHGETLTTVINTEHLEKIKRFKNKWFAIDYGNGLKYVTGYLYNKGKQKTIYLHRFITDAPNSKIVDHINHNGLDNRTKNLRLVDRSVNALNSRIYKTNKTGVKNVRWNDRYGYYEVRIRVKGKEYSKYGIKTLEEATVIADEYKNKALKENPNGNL